ncbi:MAG: type II toxin-antitoxin system RelE/ParE family toxin [Spirochaetes bacterium]|nr:type II toxin-antitoxin system RelE/ParE family toxin [Spirochaetota bacterium]
MNKVSIKKSALKELKAVPQNPGESVKETILKLKDNPLPEGCGKLSVYGSCYRIRKGACRILYEIKADTTVVVFKVGHRMAV